jgi:hypothetical protein
LPRVLAAQLRTRRQICTFGLVGVAIAVLAASCGQANPSANAPGPSAAPSLTQGDAGSAQLLGDWFLPSAVVRRVMGNSSCTLLKLTLTATTYRLTHTDISVCGTSSSGEVKIIHSEIDFFNADACGLVYPDGVGRYTWTLASGHLTFSPLNLDRCPRGAEWLANRTYSRTQG